MTASPPLPSTNPAATACALKYLLRGGNICHLTTANLIAFHGLVARRYNKTKAKAKLAFKSTTVPHLLKHNSQKFPPATKL